MQLISNFYTQSLCLIKTRTFYIAQKLVQSDLKNFNFQPIKMLKISLIHNWPLRKNTYFLWHFLRTAFYFQRLFSVNPVVRYYNSKYLDVSATFFNNEPEFFKIMNYLMEYRIQTSKLLTKNYLARNNCYLLDLRESQTKLLLSKTAIFDFYNWKNKVPIIIYPKTPSKIPIIVRKLFRYYYVQLYFQLFAYKNFKNALSLSPLN